MSNLENLTEKIRRDSRQKAQKIQEEAQMRAAAIVAEAEAGANQQRDKLIQDAVAEAARQEEQIVLGKTLSVRDDILDAKQQVLERVFAAALERMNNMGREEFMRFLVDSLAALDLDGEELIVPEKYGITGAEEINAALKQRGKRGNLTLQKNPRQKIDGGFILAKDGIEQNNTFEAMLSYYRYQLESEVAAKLF